MIFRALGSYAPRDACAPCIQQFSRGGAQGAQQALTSFFETMEQVGEQLPNSQQILAQVPTQLDSLWHTDWAKWISEVPPLLKQNADDFDAEMEQGAGKLDSALLGWYKAGYLSGWMAVEYTPIFIEASQGVIAKVIESKTLSSSVRFRAAARQSRHRSFLDFRNHRNLREKRLPDCQGAWTGKPGESGWKSELDDVKMVTQGKAIRFRNGEPDFSPWARGRFQFAKGELKGADRDFDLVYKRIAEERRLPSDAAARSWLRKEGLTPHHVDRKQIQLIPTALHGNVPHTGGASVLRAR